VSWELDTGAIVGAVYERGRNRDGVVVSGSAGCDGRSGAWGQRN
jgi:hypothetical protein